MIPPYLCILFSCCFLLAWYYRHLGDLFIRFPDVEGAISMEDVLERSKTGDLVLFSGYGRDSAVVKAWSGCVWSHVGMVVEDPSTHEKYLYHSDACCARRNASDGCYGEGVQMNDLRLYLQTFSGDSYYCPLITPRPLPISKVMGAIRVLNGIDFNHDWIELLRCTHGPGGGYLGSRAENVDVYFCSQLVAHIYYVWGVIGDAIPFNEYHPASFAKELDVDWKPGCSTGELLWIVVR